ncbi:hypothetical protein M2319_002529 [Rhodobium gokarnense]|uniref:Secreted protein n=1 Tax=Rhodobium gokarnense TaxID=364296 RepID=A0ABT3HCS1_9HYPH|nr:hypothetical protein [Rhodobium gokarnense]
MGQNPFAGRGRLRSLLAVFQVFSVVVGGPRRRLDPRDLSPALARDLGLTDCVRPRRGAGARINASANDPWHQPPPMPPV